MVFETKEIRIPLLQAEINVLKEEFLFTQVDTSTSCFQCPYFDNAEAAAQWFVFTFGIWQCEKAFWEQLPHKIPEHTTKIPKTHGSKNFTVMRI